MKNAIVGLVCLAVIGGVGYWLIGALQEQQEIHQAEEAELQRQMAAAHARRLAGAKQQAAGKPAPNPRAQWFADAKALQPGSYGPGDPGEKLAARVLQRSELVIELGPGADIGLVHPAKAGREMCAGVADLEERMKPLGELTQVGVMLDKRDHDEAVLEQVKALLARRSIPIVVVQQARGSATEIDEVIVR